MLSKKLTMVIENEQWIINEIQYPLNKNMDRK